MSKKQIQNDRIEKNLKVLKLLSNNEPNISEEQKREVLNAYSGWGGLRDAIFTPSVYRRLKYYLSDDEISSVKKTVNSAYYTPDLLVKFIWAALMRMGLKGDHSKPRAKLNFANKYSLLSTIYYTLKI
jgi:hypothetical protein